MITDELIADDVYFPQKPFTATEALALYRSNHDRFLDRISKIRLESLSKITSGYNNTVLGKSAIMSLHDSETGKVVKKLKRRFRPVVKSTKPLPGWRRWSVVIEQDKPCLYSVTRKHAWDRPVCTTALSQDGELKRVSVDNPAVSSPSLLPSHLDYGVYSYKTPQLLWEWNGPFVDVVMGRVENYGHIIEHEHGYRAQKAIVQELWVLTDSDHIFGLPMTDFLQGLSDKYECPAHHLKDDQVNGWIKFYSEESENV